MFSHGVFFYLLHFSAPFVCLFKIIFILREIIFSAVVKAIKTISVGRSGLSYSVHKSTI